MNLSAIIAEYNPLHNGHLYHIRKTKELSNSDAIICIMSGNYVQRGIPSIIDKWNRTRVALECGVDLVIELPVVYSLASAEFFAFGAISLLNNLGVVNSICFGSELGSLNFIHNAAEILLNEPNDYKDNLKLYLNQGHGYAYSRSKALIDYLSTEAANIDSIFEILNSSNNILALEYCKNILKLKSNIKSFTIKREGGSYNSTQLSNSFSSATSIRKYLKESNNISTLYNHMPEKSYNLLETLEKRGYPFVSEDSMLPYLKYKSYTSKYEIFKIPDVSEGIHNKIFKSLDKADSYNNLIGEIKSKRYTYTRISRILCQYFVGFEHFDILDLRNKTCPYARVLGFTEKGTQILRSMKGNSSIPIYTKLPNNCDDTLNLDIQATKSYSILNNHISPYSDYLISPIKVK